MRVNWKNFLTVGSAGVLIGVQLIGLGYATGWAVAGLTGLGELGAYVFEVLFSLIGLGATLAFLRSANRVEPAFGDSEPID